MTEQAPTERSLASRESRKGVAQQGAWGRLMIALSAGVLGVLTFLALEAVGVGVAHHAQLAGPWELRVALTRILPVACISSLPVIALFVLVGEALDSPRVSSRRALSLAASLAVAAFGWSITFGRHFQRILVRLGFVGGLALLAGAFVWFLSPRVTAARRRHPHLFALACVLLVLLAELVNLWVLPRLYPPWHVALSVLAVGAAAWASRPITSALSRRAVLGAASGVVLVMVAAFPFAIEDLPKWDNVRFVYIENAPTLAHALRIASVAHPPETTPVGLPTAVEGPSRQWISWRNRDVLLISIDAMRADHLGAYGSARGTTPNIDALATRGVVFDHAYTAMPHTSYAMTSLMTGKYMRPLLLQGTGQDSDTLAGILREYGYRTAAFYPPSLFAVDEERFAWAKRSGLSFEYRKVEYADAALRTKQTLTYLRAAPPDHKLLVWTHLFEPHEPYVRHPEHDFGARDVDLYDGEIAAADDAVGELVSSMLAQRPDTVVIITADHGEAFGEHGAYYHGTTVYEEQARVPLIVLADGLSPRRVDAPVQLIDILPTILRAMDIPKRPRVRGNDLGARLSGHGEGPGIAFSECHDQTLLAEASWRLLCQRKIDACSLFDLGSDPGENHDVSARHPDRFDRMRRRLRSVEAAHGTYERAGSRAEGKDLPAALVRGMAGDADAAMDVAALLDDADVVLRRKAAKVLFRLARDETTPALTLAVSRDEDTEVRRWCALALTRLGHGAPLTSDLLDDEQETWRRFAALALAESGDGQGEGILLSWWNAPDVPVEQRKVIAKALAKIRSRSAVVPLSRSLDDEKLRPTLVRALAKIGDPYARIPLLRYFEKERYVHTRLAIARALVELGASREIAPALVRFLGVPDPLDGGLELALRANILDAIGGPASEDLVSLTRLGLDGSEFRVVVPKGGNGNGLRLVLRARTKGQAAARVHIAFPSGHATSHAPIDGADTVTIEVSSPDWHESSVTLPKDVRASAGRLLHVLLTPGRGVRVAAFAVVPLADDLPPPAPEPWDAGADGSAAASPDSGP